MLTALAQWWLKKSQLTDKNDWFYNWALGGARSTSGIVVSPQRALSEVVVLACVSIRAQDLAKLPVHVYRSKKNGGQEVIKNHPLERLLAKPNSWQTRFEFLETMQVNYLLKSNAYAPILRDGRAKPIGLIPVQNAQLYAAGAEIYYDVQRANEFERAQLKTFPEHIPAADMVHLRWMSLDGLSGISRIALLRNSIGLGLSLEDAQSGVFKRGTLMPGYWKTANKLSEEAFKRLKAQLGKYEGSENAGGTPLTEEGLTFEKFAMTMVEADTVQAVEAQMKRVAIGWDLPLHRIGIVPEGSDPVEMHQMYLNNTLSSDAERWEAKLNDMFDLDGEEEFVEFDLDYFNRATLKDRLEAARIAVVGSIFTPNEGRRYVRLGLPDDPKGDVIFQPANVVPLGTEPKEPAPNAVPPGPGSDTTGEPAAGGDGDPAAVPPVDEQGKN